MLLGWSSRLSSGKGRTFRPAAIFLSLAGIAVLLLLSLNDGSHILSKLTHSKGEDDEWRPIRQLTKAQQAASETSLNIPHTRLTSNTTLRIDGTYFDIVFPGISSYNPNIIPHPSHEDTYIVVAQRDKKDDDELLFYTALVCEAKFAYGELRCVTPVSILPIASTSTTVEACGGSKYESEALDFIGPHDTRVFYGMDGHPYAMWSAQAQRHCFGQWIQRLDRLVPWLPMPSSNMIDPYFYPTDLQRAPPYGIFEKNWFIFWDRDKQPYVHYEIYPRRNFAKLEANGSAGEDMAPLAAKKDESCLAKYMPAVNKEFGLEWIHQSTNTLAVTLCNRTDIDCIPDAPNTKIITIFQHKSFYFHGVYEPYVMAFDQKSPFRVYGISSKALWFEGRGEPGGNWTKGSWRPQDQSAQIFVMSISWRSPSSTYHGYLDDEIFVSFGVEDQASGGAAYLAKDLLAELSLCK